MNWTAKFLSRPFWVELHKTSPSTWVTFCWARLRNILLIIVSLSFLCFLVMIGCLWHLSFPAQRFCYTELLFEELNGVFIINGVKIEAKSHSESTFMFKKKLLFYMLYIFFLHVISLMWQKSWLTCVIPFHENHSKCLFHKDTFRRFCSEILTHGHLFS